MFFYHHLTSKFITKFPCIFCVTRWLGIIDQSRHYVNVHILCNQDVDYVCLVLDCHFYSMNTHFLDLGHIDTFTLDVEPDVQLVMIMVLFWKKGCDITSYLEVWSSHASYWIFKICSWPNFLIKMHYDVDDGLLATLNVDAD